MIKTSLKHRSDGRRGPKTFGNVVLVRNGGDVDIFFRDPEGRVCSLECAGAGVRLMPLSIHGDEIELSSSFVRTEVKP